MEHVQHLIALCSSDAAIGGGLLLGLFLAGAAGSVLHCAPMCGVFVLGQVADRMARVPHRMLCESMRIRSGLLVPYHLGRLTTYAGLGAVAGGSAAVFAGSFWTRPVSAVLLAVAAGLFISHAAGRLAGLRWADRAPAWWGRFLGRISARIPRGSAAGEFLLGLALGFLPCGFLYGALAAAAASGAPLLGAAAMLAFGLGTVPSLMVVGVAGQAAGRRWNRGVTAAAPVVMGLNAVLLLILAWQRLA
ncbi:MAG: sulfite exporter TauE/SafE family protein [Acetobacteraceae bacterium]|nr:sulfite exporter TauE/SafE family protein [Pseudomonadota bacterium]